jgi:glycerophosphoryl diester phosphodiesterase
VSALALPLDTMLNTERHFKADFAGRPQVSSAGDVSQVIAARDRGSIGSVVAWTVNDEAQLMELMTLGVNGIITDYPGRLRHVVTTLHTHATIEP